MVACGPTLGPLIAPLFGRTRTKKASSEGYPSYPERHQQFSNISDSEYPLQPIYGNRSVADSKKVLGRPPAVRGAPSPLEDIDRNPGPAVMEGDVRSPGIRVQKDYTVKRSTKDLVYE